MQAMHRGGILALSLIVAPALAAKKLPPLPPLPPLVLDAASPVVTVTIDGQPLRLRVDPAASRHVEINAGAAARLGLAAPGRRIRGRPADLGRATTDVGKVEIKETTSGEILRYAGRDVPATLAWPAGDPVAGADGLINPRFLPHDSIRFVRRAAAPADVVTHLPMRWVGGRGLLGTFPLGDEAIDIVFAPAAPASLATAAAASLLAAGHGGRLTGGARNAVISHGVARPVRDVVFARVVDVAGVRLTRVAARIFDWSGPTDIPDADLAVGEVVARGRVGRQRQWAKLALGADALAPCAEIRFTREPLAIDLICPALQ